MPRKAGVEGSCNGVRSKRPQSGGTELGSGLGRRRWQRWAVTFPRGLRVIFRKRRMY